MTYVWDVVRNIEQALELPGGIYNFGSGNSRNSYELFLEAAKLMGVGQPYNLILPDEERYAPECRNLAMDCSLVAKYGIHFRDSIEGMEEALKHPVRTE